MLAETAAPLLCLGPGLRGQKSAWRSLHPVVDRDSLAYLTAAVENANDAVIVCEFNAATGRYVMRYVNPMFERQTGYSKAEALGQPPELLYGPNTDREAVESTKRTLLAKLPRRLELLKYRKNGEPFWTEMNLRPLLDAHGELTGYVGIQRDIDERVEATARLRLLSAAVDQASDAIAIFEWREAGGWRFHYVNDAFLRMTGYRRDDVIGRSSDFLVGPQTDAAVLNAYRTSLIAGEVVRGEIAFHRADGKPFWAELNATPIHNPAGKVINTVIVYRDVTEQHFRDERLTFEAAHDPLTGIYNRRFFMQALEDAVWDAKRRGSAHGLLFFDLDGFKPVNDLYGHEAGDRLLVGLTAEIGGRLRRFDVFARIGGDEFAILLHGCTRDQAERIARDVLDAVREFSLVWDGRVLRAGSSIGVIGIDESMESGASALRRADEACYEAKRAGRNRVVVAGA